MAIFSLEKLIRKVMVYSLVGVITLYSLELLMITVKNNGYCMVHKKSAA